jgi:hypothetical protein
VNRLLKQFVQMQKMLKSLGGLAGMSGGKKGRRQADAARRGDPGCSRMAGLGAAGALS